MTTNSFFAGKSLSILLCTIVFSTTCVLGAVGPAMAGGKASAASAGMAERPASVLLA